VGKYVTTSAKHTGRTYKRGLPRRRQRRGAIFVGFFFADSKGRKDAGANVRAGLRFKIPIQL